MQKNMFARASAGLNLTPGERAALKALWGLGYAAIAAGLTAVAQYLATGGANWQTAGKVFAVGAIMALGYAANKWATAQGDPPLAVVPPDAPVAAQPPAPQAGA